MKLAVSIPDDLARAVDRSAERHGLSRSAVYAKALERWLTAEGEDPVATAINASFTADPDVARPAFNSGRELIDAGQWDWDE